MIMNENVLKQLDKILFRKNNIYTLRLRTDQKENIIWFDIVYKFKKNKKNQSIKITKYISTKERTISTQYLKLNGYIHGCQISSYNIQYCWKSKRLK